MFRLAVLKKRQMIPPLTARTPDGRTVQAWDFKQKKNLVLAFLHAECPRCQQFLARLAERAADLAEREAVALVIFSATPSALLLDNLPREIIVATDMSGRAQRAFLGEEEPGQPATAGVGVFVADRYGELFAQWTGGDDALPAVWEALSGLEQIQVACEECGAPEWKLDA